MLDAPGLAAFVMAVIVLVLVPGPNTMVILAHALSGTRRVALATVAGVETGTLVHTLTAALGVSVLLSMQPRAFIVLKLAGASFLLFLAWRTLADQEPPFAVAARIGPADAYRRALLTNVLNPKSALFFLAFLPQFVDTGRGHVFLQFMMLGAIVSLVGSVIGGAMALGAAAFTRWLQRHRQFWKWQRRATAVILAGTGLRLAVMR
jgi:threonine/homoserine/homoserine lactone efflux protein